MCNNLKRLNEFFTSSSADHLSGPKFGITIATFQRKNGNSPVYLKRSLESVLKQTASNWKVYLVGDKYEDNLEFETIIKTVFQGNLDKIQYVNLAEPGERGKILDSKALWQVAGSVAFNTGIQMALDDGCDYILHLDDDDWFHVKKIEMLNYTCSVFSNPDYIFHYSTYVRRQRFPDTNIEVFDLDNLLPRPAGLIHSTMCCARSIMENFKYNNKSAVCGDIQLISYTNQLKKQKNIRIIFIPLVLGYHPTQGELR